MARWCMLQFCRQHGPASSAGDAERQTAAEGRSQCFPAGRVFLTEPDDQRTRSENCDDEAVPHLPLVVVRGTPRQQALQKRSGSRAHSAVQQSGAAARLRAVHSRHDLRRAAAADGRARQQKVRQRRGPRVAREREQVPRGLCDQRGRPLKRQHPTAAINSVPW